MGAVLYCRGCFLPSPFVSLWLQWMAKPSSEQGLPVQDRRVGWWDLVLAQSIAIIFQPGSSEGFQLSSFLPLSRSHLGAQYLRSYCDPWSEANPRGVLGCILFYVCANLLLLTQSWTESAFFLCPCARERDRYGLRQLDWISFSSSSPLNLHAGTDSPLTSLGPVSGNFHPFLQPGIEQVSFITVNPFCPQNSPCCAWGPSLQGKKVTSSWAHS